MEFEWDDAKADSNLAKHGVDFAAASRVFRDPNRRTQIDPRRYGELRLRTVGLAGDMILLVVYTMRGAETYRVISARRANRREREDYTLQARD